MKKKVLLFFASAVVALLCVSACSSGDDENASSDNPAYDVSYYDRNPDLSERQGYWYNGTFIRLTPQENPSYRMLLKWDSDEGKQALDYITGNNDGVVVERYDNSANMALIVSNKYLVCPYLYISSSYKMSDGSLYDIWINNVILLKMKDGKSIDSIAQEYADALIHDSSKADGVEAFRCKLKTSCEMLQLVETIRQRNDVEWTEPDMYAPVLNEPE